MADNELQRGPAAARSHDFDLFVIGGGSGGVRAARIAAGHGARVAIAEEYRFGGTCVIRGCVPKKLLVYASRFTDDFEDATGFGWSVGERSFDWGKLVAAKDREIGRLEGIYAGNLEKVGVTLFEERATLAGPNRIRLASGRELSAGRILVATGGRPVMPHELSGIEHAISSNEAFDLATFPRRIVIVGGGYISLEFAGIFAGLGAEVTVLHRGNRLLRGFDEDIADGVLQAYRARGIRIELQTSLLSLARGAATGPVTATLTTGARLEADQVMLAIGRVPNVEGLGLDSVGVATDSQGAIVVDALSRSSVPSVYAIGDVTHRLNLTPVAIREGHAFADAVFGDRPWAVDYDNIPTAVFSTPEIGTVGLCQADALTRFPVVDVYRTSFRTLKATVSGSEERMMMKVLVDASSDRLIGVHLLGPDAGELVQVIATLLRTGATKRALDETMPLHPTSAEELMTLRTPSARYVCGELVP
jgi:glutathione reductase (NADPH)